MNVTLIYPAITKEERYGSKKIGESGGTQQPLGIAYLGAYLRDKGVSVQLIDAEREGLAHDDILTRCRDFGTGLYAISTTTIVFAKALELARFLKEKTPGIPVVVGGPHVSGAPEETMGHGCFDAGVFGEGEVTLHEVVKAYSEGRGLEGIDGVVYMKDGKPVKNNPREYLKDLDSLPFPARDLLPSLEHYLPPPLNYKREPCATIITTRGCPYGCTFCDHNTFGRLYRMRSAENIVAEMEHLISDYGVREFAFVDDTFNINDKRLNNLFALMKQRGINVPWTCMARINTASYEQLKAMKEAGCWHISFGIESGNPEIIELIKKGIDLQYTRRVIGWCKELGIYTKGFFIIGHPGETARSIEDTIAYAISMPLTDVVVTLNTPLPGSWNFDNIERFGHMATVDWSKHNMWIPVFVPKGLSEGYLERKHREFIRKFYLRPSVILEHLMQVRRLGETKRFIKMGRSALAVLWGK
jgi:radical SAM superfamily enzyme YgiQ (UPF0313 family)